MQKMKKSTFITFFIVAYTLLSANISAQNTMKPTKEAVDKLRIYPEKVGTLIRHYIYLKKETNEILYSVEFFPGIYAKVDNCNKHFLGGEFKKHRIKDSELTYYVFYYESTHTTARGCPEPSTIQFVTGPKRLVRYDSRLPLVVYLPEGMELKYRAQETSSFIEEEYPEDYNISD